MPELTQKPLPVSSSTPPDFPQEQCALFREVLALLNQGQVPYVVSGAFALQKHTGIWRDTKDLDLFMPAGHVDTALCQLKEDGFEIEVTDPFWLAKARRNGFFVDLITGMSNGMITVDDSWIARGVRAEIMGVPTRVLAAEELVASKLFVSFRERFDGADIAHVLYRTHHHFDWGRMLELVGTHWQLLLWTLVLFHYIYPSAGGHVPHAVWNELLRRFQDLIQEPDTAARFRGTLIDDKMFAIDVQEWGLANLLEEERARRKDRISKPGDQAA